MRSKKLVFRDEQIPKTQKFFLKGPSKKLPELFGPRTIDPICFHEDGVIYQSELMFSKKFLPN